MRRKSHGLCAAAVEITKNQHPLLIIIIIISPFHAGQCAGKRVLSVPAHEIRFRLSHNKNHSLMVQFKYSSSSLPSSSLASRMRAKQHNTRHGHTHTQSHSNIQTIGRKMNSPVRRMRRLSSAKNWQESVDEITIIFQWTHTCEAHSWDRIHIRGEPCWLAGMCSFFFPEHDSIENALPSMDAAVNVAAVRIVVWESDRMHRWELLVVSCEKRTAAAAQFSIQRQCRSGWIFVSCAATKISMKYHFVSVCIGRTKLQHRLRGATENSFPLNLSQSLRRWYLLNNGSKQFSRNNFFFRAQFRRMVLYLYRELWVRRENNIKLFLCKTISKKIYQTKSVCVRERVP